MTGLHRAGSTRPRTDPVVHCWRTGLLPRVRASKRSSGDTRVPRARVAREPPAAKRQHDRSRKAQRASELSLSLIFAAAHGADDQQAPRPCAAPPRCCVHAPCSLPLFQALTSVKADGTGTAVLLTGVSALDRRHASKRSGSLAVSRTQVRRFRPEAERLLDVAGTAEHGGNYRCNNPRAAVTFRAYVGVPVSPGREAPAPTAENDADRPCRAGRWAALSL